MQLGSNKRYPECGGALDLLIFDEIIVKDKAAGFWVCSDDCEYVEYIDMWK